MSFGNWERELLLIIVGRLLQCISVYDGCSIFSEEIMTVRCSYIFRRNSIQRIEVRVREERYARTLSVLGCRVK